MLGGHLWQAREDGAQVGVGIEAAPPAAFDDGVDDGAALAGFGVADEEPVFLAESGGANGVFHEVVVDLHAAIVHINFQGAPLAERVIQGLAQAALRQITALRLEQKQNFFEPGHDGAAFTGAPGLAQIRAGVLFAQRGFDTVEVLDLPQEPAADLRGRFAGLVKLPADVCPAAGECDASAMPVRPLTKARYAA